MAGALTPAGRRTVHERALELLEAGGMRVEHAEARAVLEGAGAEIDGDLVRLPQSLVEDAVENAPAAFRWRARDDEKSVVVGEGTPVVAPARGPRYVKLYGEPRRRATMADFELLVQLVHQEPTVPVVGYDLCSPEGYSLPGDPGGFEQAAVGYELLERLFTGTDKPVVASARRDQEAKASLDMARIAFQDPDLDEPSVLGILHVRSPRVFNEPMVAGLLRFARAGQPLVISSGAIAGASGPHSLAETAVQFNAESLFGVVLAQVVNPGTPVVYGHSSTVYDRSTEAVTYGSPRGSVFSTIAAEMGRFYDLPVRGQGAVTDAPELSDQSGSDSMFHVRGAVETGGDLLLNAVGVLDTHAVISPEKLVLDAERFRAVRETRRETAAALEALDAGTVSVDTSMGADPGTPFFDDRDPASLEDAARFEHGEASGRDVKFESEIAVRQTHEDWLAGGGLSVAERAADRVSELVEAYERPHMDDAVADELADYVAANSSMG